jgi:hypothetical protein
MLVVRETRDPEEVAVLLEQAQANPSGHWTGSSPNYGRYVVVDQATGTWVVVSDY